MVEGDLHAKGHLAAVVPQQCGQLACGRRSYFKRTSCHFEYLRTGHALLRGQERFDDSLRTVFDALQDPGHGTRAPAVVALAIGRALPERPTAPSAHAFHPVRQVLKLEQEMTDYLWLRCEVDGLAKSLRPVQCPLLVSREVGGI